MSGLLVGGAIAWFGIWLAGFLRATREPPSLHLTDDVLITPHGVEIPLAWVACEEDVDEILATLEEIDRLGTGATA